MEDIPELSRIHNLSQRQGTNDQVCQSKAHMCPQAGEAHSMLETMPLREPGLELDHETVQVPYHTAGSEAPEFVILNH